VACGEIICRKLEKLGVLETTEEPSYYIRPSAEAVQGEWQKVEEQPYFRKHYDTVCCSVCRKKGNRKWNFCPNCGARMKGGAE